MTVAVVCRNDGTPAETWADMDTPVGTLRVWLCRECLDEERWPTLSWVDAVELAIAYHSIDGHDPEQCSSCVEDAALAARGRDCCREHDVDHVHGCYLQRGSDGGTHAGTCRTVSHLFQAASR